MPFLILGGVLAALFALRAKSGAPAPTAATPLAARSLASTVMTSGSNAPVLSPSIPPWNLPPRLAPSGTLLGHPVLGQAYYVGPTSTAPAYLAPSPVIPSFGPSPISALAPVQPSAPIAAAAPSLQPGPISTQPVAAPAPFAAPSSVPADVITPLIEPVDSGPLLV